LLKYFQSLPHSGAFCPLGINHALIAADIAHALSLAKEAGQATIAKQKIGHECKSRSFAESCPPCLGAGEFLLVGSALMKLQHT
jgi:hypothetical protein